MINYIVALRYTKVAKVRGFERADHGKSDVPWPLTHFASC